MKLIRGRIDAEAERILEKTHKDDTDAHDNNDADILTSFEGHIKLGAPCQQETIQQIVNNHRSEPAFDNFNRKFTAFINQCIPVYLELDPNSWDIISFPETFQVRLTTTTYYHNISLLP